LITGKGEIKMNTEKDLFEKEGRKMKRHVITTSTHDIKLIFLSGVSKKKEQMAAVEEAETIVRNMNGDLLKLTSPLSELWRKHGDIGCVGYSLTKAGGAENKLRLQSPILGHKKTKVSLMTA
jgi:hypothetical protein